MNYIADISKYIKEIELRQNPVIVTVNEFTEESVQKFQESMNAAQNSGQKIIPIEIDSYGGDVYALLSMISIIKNSKVPVATIVQGKAMSCGAILASFGAKGKRYMDEDATIMIHDISGESFGKIEDLKSATREAERLQNNVYKMMAKNCGKQEDYFIKLIHDKGRADWYLDAEESLTHNIVDQIGVPTLGIKIDVEIDFI